MPFRSLTKRAKRLNTPHTRSSVLIGFSIALTLPLVDDLRSLLHVGLIVIVVIGLIRTIIKIERDECQKRVHLLNAIMSKDNSISPPSHDAPGKDLFGLDVPPRSTEQPPTD